MHYFSSKTKWHHVVELQEGNSLDLYLDGKHVGQKSTTVAVYMLPDINNRSILVIWSLRLVHGSTWF